MKKGKIIIINHYGITPDMPGATKHYDLARYFSEKGEYEIEFWMCGYNHVTGKYADGLNGINLQYKYQDNGIKIVKIKSAPYWGSNFMRQLNILLFDFLVGIKLFFSRGIKCIILSMPPITFFATDAAYIRNMKMVADVEDLWPLFIEDMGMKNKIVSTYMEHFANHSYNLSTAFEAVSKGMLDYVQGKIKDKNKKSWLAPLGVNLNLVGGKIDKNVINHYKWKDDFIVMYAGAHGRANDLESVLQTISLFEKEYHTINGKKVSFVFIGNGDNKELLVKLSNTLKLKNVYFEDAVPSSEIPKILMNANVCLTNLRKIESFKLVRPNKIFQYMAAKKPILCGIWGEASDVVREAGAGIYVDFTSSGAADKLYEFMSRSELEQIGNRGFEYVSKYGNRDIIFEEFYGHIKEILEC